MQQHVLQVGRTNAVEGVKVYVLHLNTTEVK